MIQIFSKIRLPAAYKNKNAEKAILALSRGIPIMKDGKEVGKINEFSSMRYVTFEQIEADIYGEVEESALENWTTEQKMSFEIVKR